MKASNGLVRSQMIPEDNSLDLHVMWKEQQSCKLDLDTTQTQTYLCAKCKWNVETFYLDSLWTGDEMRNVNSLMVTL